MSSHHQMEHHRPVRIGILGWIGRGNIGDELLRRAITGSITAAGAKVVPFVGTLGQADVNSVDGLVIGGGSLLDGAPDVAANVDMSMIPIAYVSVGMETVVHPGHRRLLARAHTVIHRSPASQRKVDKLQNDILAIGRWYCMPDIVYSLSWETSPITFRMEKNILVMPNVEVVPPWTSPHWAHLAWERYKDEFAQFADAAIDEGWVVRFVGSCCNPKQDDMWAAAEIMGRMRHRDHQMMLGQLPEELDTIVELVSSYRVVISQRFHGSIIARCCGVPSVSIHHHDKLRDAHPSATSSVSFHGVTKDALRDAFHAALGADQQHIPNVKLYDRYMADFISSLSQRTP